jgi:DNA/RNA-binding domain of Phe-tRNA-synthetase-like protein
MDIYTIVDDPANAPLAIFSLVLAPFGLMDIAAVAKAADLKRAMKGEDVVKLGKNLEPAMNIINKCTGMCLRK